MRYLSIFKNSKIQNLKKSPLLEEKMGWECLVNHPVYNNGYHKKPMVYFPCPYSINIVLVKNLLARIRFEARTKTYPRPGRIASRRKSSSPTRSVGHHLNTARSTMPIVQHRVLHHIIIIIIVTIIMLTSRSNTTIIIYYKL